MVFRNFIIIILCFLVMSCAHAGIRLNKTRVIFNEKNPSTSITFSNTGKDNYLVEAAVIDPGIKSGTVLWSYRRYFVRKAGRAAC